MKRIWPLIPLILLFTACPKDGLDRTALTIEGQRFQVEVAVSDQERNQGLMGRESLEEGHGMLFVFRDSRSRSFWMKDTLIPLSIAFIDEEGIIINIRDMNPLDTTSVRSAGPARYALELNQGEFSRKGIEPGDLVEIPEEYK